MAVRLRSLLLAAALGVAGPCAIGALAAPAGAQDVTSTTAAVATAAEVTTTVAEGPETTQEVIAGSSSESSLFTESRKVAATIGGLLIAAIGLTLLTIRYWRATRPIPIAPPGDPRPLRPGTPVTGTESAIVAAALPSEPAASSAPLPAASADHPRADADYEPQGTGEHARVELTPVASSNRPGPAARAAALGRSAPA